MAHSGKGLQYHLRFRLEELPQYVYQQIKERFNALPGKSNSRWQDILNDRMRDLQVQEALIICQEVGCTLEELCSPDTSLSVIHHERSLKKEMDNMAQDLGLRRGKR